MNDNLTVKALLARAVQRLRQSLTEPAACELDAELLLGHELSLGRAQLKAHPERMADPAHARRFLDKIERRAAGEPVAYLLGYRDFWTFRLNISPDVLIPRPETELLVERALALGPEGSADVVDLGTGSGAVALALAGERPQWHLTATDISEPALSVARANASALGLGRVEFLRGPWLEPLQRRQFDLIVSNPPYVAETDIALRNLRFEPRGALIAGSDGLSAIREIVGAAAIHLRGGGWLVLEHGFDQAGAVRRDLVEHGFGHVRSHRDLAGHERVTEARWT
jgi:release factor glutamine methyltransferase